MSVWSLLVLHPVREILGDEDNVIQKPADLSQVGLKARLADVEFASFSDGIGIVLKTA